MTDLKSGTPLDPAQLPLIGGVLDGLPFGISFLDEEFRLIYANARYYDLHELPREVAKRGTPVRDIIEYLADRGEFIGTDSQTFVRDEMERLASREGGHVERARPRGRWISITTIPSTGGRLIRIHRDITADIDRRWKAEGQSVELKTRIRELEAQLEETQRRLAQALRG